MLPLIFAAVMVGQSLLSSKKEDEQAKLTNIANKSNARVSNILRQADNQMQAAKDNLARYQQSQSNKYKLMSGGEELNAQATNMLRFADEAAAGSFERRIAVAEEAGAQAAAAGAAGVGGGSVAMVENANRLRAQRVEEQYRQRTAQQLGDMELNLDQTERAMILGLDDTQIFTSQNYIETQAQKVPRVNWAEAGLKAGLSGATAFMQAGGEFKMPGRAPVTTPQQSLAGPGLSQSAAVSTSPFGARPQPTLRMK